jgi:ribA/ribD-fused uncharacterized protein
MPVALARLDQSAISNCIVHDLGGGRRIPSTAPRPGSARRLPSRPYKMDQPTREPIIIFYSRSKRLAILSNFHPQQITVRGKTFSCPEACFHYAKLQVVSAQAAPARALELKTHAEKLLAPELPPAEAKRIGGKSKAGLALTEEELKRWDRACVGMQREICRARLNQGGPELLDALMATGDATLLHFERMASSDSFWGGKEDPPGRVTGQNWLGRIWMGFRDITRCRVGQGPAPAPGAMPDFRSEALRGAYVKLEPKDRNEAAELLRYFEDPDRAPHEVAATGRLIYTFLNERGLVPTAETAAGAVEPRVEGAR